MTVKRGIGQGFGFGIGCLLLGVAIVVTLIAIGASTQKNGAISDPAPQAPAAAPTAIPHAPAVLLTLKGHGIQRTDRFTVLGDWMIGYAYDCTSFGFDGNFIVTVYTGDGQLVDLAANALGRTGKGSQPEYRPGTFYLEVNSECDWAVGVEG